MMEVQTPLCASKWLSASVLEAACLCERLSEVQVEAEARCVSPEEPVGAQVLAAVLHPRQQVALSAPRSE